jgi:DNA-binding beta-propeller fold protein YncE
MRATAVGPVTAVLSCLAITAMAQSNAIALDSEDRQVAFLDLAKGTVDSKVSVPLPALSSAVVSPDNGTIVAIYDGGHRVTGFVTLEIHPVKKGSYVVVTRDKTIGAGDLGWGLAGAAFSSDGRYAYVLTEGDDAKDDEDLRPSDLIRIDAVSGAEAGRLTFNRSASALGFDRSGATAIVFSPMQSKRDPQTPARLVFVDTGTWKESGSLDIPGRPAGPVRVGELFYFVDPGEKNASGKVHIVDPAKRSIVKSIDVGAGAKAGGSDRDGNFFVLSQGSDRKAGQVTILRGRDVAATYSTGAAPQRVTLSADGKRLYVLGNQLNVVDLAAKSSSRGVDAARPAIALLAASDGRRVITVTVEGENCCRISVFDTAANKQLTSFLGGSKGKRIGQGLAAAALTVASYEAGRAAAGSSGSFFYSIYTPTFHGAARGPVAFGPAEKKAYAVDTQTHDVTVVDMETGQRTVNIDAGSGLKEVVPLPDAGLMAAVSDERIDLIDTTTDLVRESIKMKGGVHRAVVTPDEKRMVVLGKERIVVFDTATGKQAGMIDALKNPSQLIFLK